MADMWKWVAASMLLIMLAGAPSYIELLRGPTTGEVAIIRERQDSVLQRLAALDVRLAAFDVQFTTSNDNYNQLRDEIDELRQAVEGLRKSRP
jgi:hypothetical protein